MPRSVSPGRRTLASMVALAVLACADTARSQIVSEIEPNESKAAATPALSLDPGDGVTGLTLGTSTITPGDASADYFLISTAALLPDIYRHRLVVESELPGHTGSVRGLSQTGGAINPGTDATVQTSTASSTPPRFVQWYGFGRQEQLYIRITGVAATTSPYTATLSTETVTPIDGGTFFAGSITLSRPPGITTNTDMWVYDSARNAIFDFGNDNPDTLTRTFDPGVYYIAWSASNVANNQPAASGDTFLTGAVLDFADAVLASTSTSIANLPLRIADAYGPVDIAASRTDPFDIVWIRITVSAATPVTGACCLPNGSCIATTAASCATQGGAYRGDGADCVTAACPQPGGCCFSNFTCQVLSQAQCDAAGGNYVGNGTACTSCPAPPAGSVAILAATSAADINDVRDKLLSTDLFGEVIIANVSTATPTLQFLQQFQSVIVWSNLNFQNTEALGNVLADYVDAGGGVVNSVFVHTTTTPSRFLTGRWDATYQIVPQNGGTTSGAQALGEILIPGHPILNGVATFSGGTSSFRPTVTTFTSHGVPVARWSDGKTLVAISNTLPRRVDLGFYPPSRTVNTTGWDPATDGARLLANALLYAGRALCGSADFDNDGDAGTDADIEAFFACLAGNCCPACGTADFNGDGDTGTDADIEAFFRVLAGGTC